MTMREPKCVICSRRDGFMKYFSEQTLTKCTEILIVRQKYQLSHHSVVLPTMSTDGSAAYHSECYKKFTALPPKYRPKKSADTKTADSDEQMPSSNPTNNEELTSEAASGAEDSSTSKLPENITVAETNEQDGKKTDATEDTTMDDDGSVSLDASNNSGEEIDDPAIGSNEITCIFCKKARKKHRGWPVKLQISPQDTTLHKLEKTAIEFIKEQLEFLKEFQSLRKAHKIAYHRCCKANYEYNLVRENRPEVDDEWHEARDNQQKAFQIICQFVSENIVEKQESYYLSFLRVFYMKYLTFNSLDIDSCLKPWHLGKALIKEFRNKINITKIGGKKVVKPIKVVLLESDEIKIDERDILCRTALIEQSHVEIPNFVFSEESTRKRKRQ